MVEVHSFFFLFFSIPHGRGKRGSYNRRKTHNGWATQIKAPKQPELRPRACLVHSNDDYQRIRISTTRNISWNGVTFHIYSFGNNTSKVTIKPSIKCLSFVYLILF